jgi:TIGR00251 family protein
MPVLSETAFKATKHGCLVSLRVQPGASRNAVVGMYGDAVKIALQAPPVDGKANQLLCRLFAEWSGLPKSAVELRSGQTGRSKVLELSGITAEQLKAILER